MMQLLPSFYTCNYVFSSTIHSAIYYLHKAGNACISGALIHRDSQGSEPQP